MRALLRPLLVLVAVAAPVGLAAPASAAPPDRLTGTVVTTDFLPLPDKRRETGSVVHFEFLLTSLLSGDVQATTREHYRCVRRVGDVIRCNVEILGTLVDSSGEPTGGSTQGHARVTCDPSLTICEGTSHYTGVDNEGRKAVGKGTLRTNGGVGTYEFQQSRP
jgi:hypothetical protein